MKKLILALGALCLLSFQSCLKEYTCVCSTTAGNVSIGTMKAATKTEADRGCGALGGSDLCYAQK